MGKSRPPGIGSAIYLCERASSQPNAPDLLQLRATVGVIRARIDGIFTVQSEDLGVEPVG